MFGDGSNQKLGEPFICNRKLIGAYAFTDTDMEVIGAGAGDFCDNVSGECSARSADGHGTQHRLDGGRRSNHRDSVRDWTEAR